jgi:hypothetical protein
VISVEALQESSHVMPIVAVQRFHSLKPAAVVHPLSVSHTQSEQLTTSAGKPMAMMRGVTYVRSKSNPSTRWRRFFFDTVTQSHSLKCRLHK